MNSMKSQKDMTPGDEPPGLEGVQYATGDEQRAIMNSSSKNEAAGPNQKKPPVVDVSGLSPKVKSNAVKNSIAKEFGVLGLWIKVNWMWPSRRWQEWTLTS